MNIMDTEYNISTRVQATISLLGVIMQDFIKEEMDLQTLARKNQGLNH